MEQLIGLIDQLIEVLYIQMYMSVGIYMIDINWTGDYKVLTYQKW